MKVSTSKKIIFIIFLSMIILVFLNSISPNSLVFNNDKENETLGLGKILYLEKVEDYELRYCEFLKTNTPELLKVEFDNTAFDRNVQRAKQNNSLYQYYKCQGSILPQKEACNFFGQGKNTNVIKKFDNYYCYKLHKLL
jgi:hypothetical protein